MPQTCSCLFLRYPATPQDLVYRVGGGLGVLGRAGACFTTALHVCSMFVFVNSAGSSKKAVAQMKLRHACNQRAAGRELPERFAGILHPKRNRQAE